MKEPGMSEVSALFDGELEDHEVRAAIKGCLNDPQHWHAYAVISDGLRGECPDTPDMTASVMARVNEEPVVLAPRNLKRPARHHPLLALAASVAGVAVVGWLALTGNPQAPLSDNSLAAASNRMNLAVSPALTFAKAPVSGTNPSLAATQDKPAAVVTQGDLNEYLLAHHAQAATARLGDSTKQVRTVALGVGRP